MAVAGAEARSTAASAESARFLLTRVGSSSCVIISADPRRIVPVPMLGPHFRRSLGLPISSGDRSLAQVFERPIGQLLARRFAPAHSRADLGVRELPRETKDQYPPRLQRHLADEPPQHAGFLLLSQQHLGGRFVIWRVRLHGLDRLRRVWR